MYQIAAQMALSMYSSAQASKARAEEETANNVAQTEKRRLQFNRDQQAYLSNMTATKRQETSDMFNIGLAAAEAEDQLALSRAGSGLSGASINELDDDIARSVGADRVTAHRNSLNAQDQLDQQRVGANENRLIEAEQAKTSNNPSKDILNGALSTLGSQIGNINPAAFSAFNTQTVEPEVPGKKTAVNTRSSMYGKSAFIA